MNTQKYRIGNCGLLREADRTMYDKSDTVSRSLIDRERTAGNYNLCPHEQYTAAEVKKINEEIRGKKLAKNAIAWGGTVVTVPQDYSGNLQDFFREAYKGLQKLYKLRDEDIISAYVHMDESTPHMHFYFIPVAHDREKDRVNWNKVMPKLIYDTQHQRLQKYMEDKLHTPVNILNGATKGIDYQAMTAEEKRLSMRVERLKKSVGDLRKREASLVNSLPSLEAEINGKKSEYTSWQSKVNEKKKEAEEISKPYIEAQERLNNAMMHLLEQLTELKPKEREKEKDIFDWLEKNGRLMGKGSTEEISKATEAVEKESSRIEADYLSIDDNDDFGLS